MNELSGNSPSELLHLYVDGELDASQEQSLFAELNSNDELRSEMRELLAIRESVKNDIDAFAPPAEAAALIFSKIGFSVPAATAVGGSVVAGGSILLFKAIKYVAVPLVTAVMASLITMWIVKSGHDSKPATNLPAKQQVIPEISSKELPPQQDNATGNVNINRKKYTSYKERRNNLAFNNIENETNTPVRASSDLSIASLGEKNDYHPQLNTVTVNNTIRLMPENPLVKHDFQGERNYSLILRGMAAASFPQSSLPSQSHTIFSNMVIGAYGKLTPEFKIGFEFGQESFGQVFKNKENTDEVTYEQNPLLYWGALAGRWEPETRIEFLWNAQPFMAILFGGNGYGPMGKGIAGLQYVSQESGIGISLGLEGTIFGYKNQNEWFSTRKLGLTYGMMILF